MHSSSAESSSHAKAVRAAAVCSVRAGEFRVVCDNMLQGLGRQLRCCGVDVTVLSNTDHHDVCASVSFVLRNYLFYDLTFRTCFCKYHIWTSVIFVYNLHGDFEYTTGKVKHD